MGRQKDNGLGPDEFIITLPFSADLVIKNREGVYPKPPGLVLTTAIAAEIIMIIADAESFVATPGEKEVLRGLGRMIAERYSGYPRV